MDCCSILFLSDACRSLCLLAGPAQNVMATGIGGNAGGLQTSTLALGLAGTGVAPREHRRTPAIERRDSTFARGGRATC